MSTDYYRCNKCDTQVDDSGYDCCDSCGASICYNCTFKLKIREKPISYDTPGKALGKKYKFHLGEEDSAYEDCPPQWCDYVLSNCPFCEKKDKVKQDIELLKYFLKQNHLTRRAALKQAGIK